MRSPSAGAAGRRRHRRRSGYDRGGQGRREGEGQEGRREGSPDDPAGPKRDLHAEGPEGDVARARLPPPRPEGRAGGLSGHPRNDPEGPAPGGSDEGLRDGREEEDDEDEEEARCDGEAEAGQGPAQGHGQGGGRSE